MRSGRRPRPGKSHAQQMRGGRSSGTRDRSSKDPTGIASHRYRLLLRSLLIFILGYVGLLVVLLFGPANVVKDTTNAWTARISSLILGLLGAQGRAEGAMVTSSFGSFEIIAECTAIYPMVTYLAAVLAFPSAWRSKLSGLAIGLPLLILFNQIRVVSLILMKNSFPHAFEALHLLVWQTLMIVFTSLLWIVWAKRTVGERGGAVA